MNSNDESIRQASAQPPLDQRLRLEVQPYESDGGWSIIGLLLFAGFATAGGIAVGYGISWINQWFYIVIAFPIVAGVGIGFLGALGLYVGKIRNALLTMLVGVYAGVLTQAALHYADYGRFLDLPAGDKPKVVAMTVREAAQREIDFIEYLDRRAAKGMPIEIKKINFTLGYYWCIGYWIVEVLIVVGFAVAIYFHCSQDPFCAICRRWKDKKLLGRLNLDAQTATQIFTSGEVIRLADHDIQTGPGRIQITTWSCQACGQEAMVDVKIEEVSKNAKEEDEIHFLAFLTFPGQSLAILESLFRPALEPMQPPPTEPGVEESPPS